MTAPVMVTVWTRNQSDDAAHWWRLYWTVALVVFLIHLIWAMAVFFQGNLDSMRETTRVSAFWPGLVFTGWWIIDVIVAWGHPEDRRWITIQRVIVHAIAFVMFTAGSLIQGEMLLASAIGVAFVASAFYGFIRWTLLRRAV